MQKCGPGQRREREEGWGGFVQHLGVWNLWGGRGMQSILRMQRILREGGIQVSYSSEEIRPCVPRWGIHPECNVERTSEIHHSRGRACLLHQMRRKEEAWPRISERAGLIHCPWTWSNSVCVKERVNNKITSKLPVQRLVDVGVSFHWNREWEGKASTVALILNTLGVMRCRSWRRRIFSTGGRRHRIRDQRG